MSEQSSSGQSESVQTLAGLIPEVLFDLLARVVPGVAFLSMIYFSAYPGTSSLFVPIQSIYQLLLLIIVAYLAGFLLEVLSLFVVALFHRLFNPHGTVIFGGDKTAGFPKGHWCAYYITRIPMFEPVDSVLAGSIKQAIHKFVGTKITRENAGDIVQTLSDHIKLREPALAAVLLKIHAEAFMFKNLMVACFIALCTEVILHCFTNQRYLAVVILVAGVSSGGFTYLSFLGSRRTYQSFLAIVSAEAR